MVAISIHILDIYIYTCYLEYNFIIYWIVENTRSVRIENRFAFVSIEEEEYGRKERTRDWFKFTSLRGFSQASRSTEKAFLVRGLVVDIVFGYPIPRILDSLGQNALKSQPRPRSYRLSPGYTVFEASGLLISFFFLN